MNIQYIINQGSPRFRVCRLLCRMARKREREQCTWAKQKVCCFFIWYWRDGSSRWSWFFKMLTLLLQNHSNARQNKTIVDFDFDERGRERQRGRGWQQFRKKSNLCFPGMHRFSKVRVIWDFEQTYFENKCHNVHKADVTSISCTVGFQGCKSYSQYTRVQPHAVTPSPWVISMVRLWLNCTYQRLMTSTAHC